MCGVFAMFLKRPLTPEDLVRGRRATSALSHRGPDAQGEWFDEAAGVFLGHRRLSIIDLSSASDQPFCDRGLALVYNGEIYNFRSVRQQLLDRGGQFSTEGDTEVLLKAWATDGFAALDRLDGMFAFALWDGESAHLAVDSFGEKSLYVAENETGVYVASELEPLIELLNPEPDLAGENLLAYLSLGYLPSPRTAWQGIRRLPAGHHAVVARGRVSTFRQYWQPPVPKVPKGRIQHLGEQEIDRFRDALVSSLEGRYEADVPMCLFLSAGIDSSLIAALSVRELGFRPDCVTVAFANSSVLNEAPLAAATATELALPHRSIQSLIDPEVASDDRVLDLFGQVNDNITVLPVQQMCAAVSKNFKVGLTGMGGDEVFYGYGKHHHLYRYRLLRHLPQALRRKVGEAGAAGARLFGRDGHHMRAFSAPDHELYLGLKNTDAFSWLRQQSGFESWARSAFTWPGREAYLKAAWYEIAENMQCSQLPAVDHGSMRASMELRTPFLSRQLVELVAEFDPRCFMALEQKAVLRHLLKRYLPKELVDQPKAGFRFPPDRFVLKRKEPDLSSLGLSKENTSEAWAKRLDSANWARVGIRMSLAERFVERAGRKPTVANPPFVQQVTA